ncbi:MAG: hypothetical protein IJK63_11630 [Oscillospiraceae bacterium]|nr:hypothetical protein [Oscillospiraceae bacterium]
MKQKSEKDRISAVLFIVVFLLVVVIVIMVLKTLDNKKNEAQAEEVTTNTQNYQPQVQDPNDVGIVVPDPAATPNPYEPVSALPGTGTGTGILSGQHRPKPP